MVLRLKAAVWVSHEIDMKGHLNKTPWFLGINPRGLVPVLVDDGKVIIESNDIVDYLDSKYPPSHSDASLAKQREVEDALHLGMRTITFNFAVPPALATPPKDKLEAYEVNGGTLEGPGQDFGEQIQFWKEYTENRGSSPKRIVKAYDDIQTAFTALDASLDGRSFLAGDESSLVDIVWFPTVNRLDICGYDLKKHHVRLAAWLGRCRSQVPAIALEAEQKGWISIIYQMYQVYIKGTTLDKAVAKYRVTIHHEAQTS